MFERIRAKYRESNLPRNVLIMVPATSAREIYSFHAMYGRDLGTQLWFGSILVAFFGLGLVVASLVAPEGSYLAALAGAAMLFVSVIVFTAIVWGVQRQIVR